MTFPEALRTGKPMRRSSWWRGQPGDRWLVPADYGTWVWNGGPEARGPDRADFLAEDWEVRP